MGVECAMASHAEHHFVPRFLLEKWHTAPDEKLTSFRWANGQLTSHRYKAKSVAKERHLYSMGRSGAVPDTRVEKEFWGPHIDDPASVVHAKILAEGVASLNDNEKKDWSPFLVSMMLRGPAMIAHMRQRGRTILAEGLDANPDDYLEVRADAPEATLREWIERHAPDVLDDLGVMALPELAFSERLNHAVLNSRWATRSVDGSRFNLLISDKPIIQGGKLESSFLLALPISPTRVFLAFNNEKTFENLSLVGRDEFVRTTNYSTVTAADRYVFGTNRSQEAFVRKFLRLPAA